MTSAGKWSVPGYLQARKRKTESGNSVACRETLPHGSETCSQQNKTFEQHWFGY